MKPGTHIRSAAQVQQLWQDLMGPGGFSVRTLWVVFLDDDSRTLDVIVPIEALPNRPDARSLTSLAGVLSDVGADAVLLLLSRPGFGAMTDDDRAWASALLSILGPMSPWPMHLATRDCVRVFAPDDLLAVG